MAGREQESAVGTAAPDGALLRSGGAVCRSRASEDWKARELRGSVPWGVDPRQRAERVVILRLRGRAMVAVWERGGGEVGQGREGTSRG